VRGAISNDRPYRDLSDHFLFADENEAAGAADAAARAFD